jgi:rhodanese-related sulfurtransferase
LGTQFDGTLIDVREPHELIDSPLIENSLSMPLSQCNIDDLRPIISPVFKCQTGRRAERVALKLALASETASIIKIIIP